MRKLHVFSMVSLSCLALGSCKDVGLGTDGVDRDGGSGGVLGTGGILETGGSGSGNILGTGGNGSGDILGTGGNGSGDILGTGGSGSAAILDPGGSGGSGTVRCSGSSIIASEVNDYAFASSLTFPLVTVAPKSDLTFDWSGVTKDFNGHAVDPKKDLNTILVLMWKLPLANLQTKLNADSLQQKDLVTIPLQYTTDGSGTSAKLLAFSNSGLPDSATILSFLDPVTYPPANYTYTLMAATGSTLGEGTRMIQSFQVSPSSTNTSVVMTTSSTKLTYTANLHTLTPTGVPAGKSAITLNWGQMTKNALGNDFAASDITKALIGQYDQTPTSLEGQFLDIELIAKKLYRGNIDSGTMVDFSQLKTSSNESFAGIDNTGTWLVALQCGGCRNPAPWYLSVLKPCSN